MHYFSGTSGYDLPEETEAVKKGAALLDKILPGWYNSINLEELNMSRGTMCMLGQLFGSGTESHLAREMYPKEMETALHLFAEKTGVNVESENLDAHGYGKMVTTNMLKNLADRVHARSTEYHALSHVCYGHDNKCLWADEIAERRAKDAAATEQETLHDNT